MKFLAENKLCIDKSQINLQKNPVQLVLKIGQHDHLYNKNIRQAIKLRYGSESINVVLRFM